MDKVPVVVNFGPAGPIAELRTEGTPYEGLDHLSKFVVRLQGVVQQFMAEGRGLVPTPGFGYIYDLDRVWFWTPPPGTSLERADYCMRMLVMRMEKQPLAAGFARVDVLPGEGDGLLKVGRERLLVCAQWSDLRKVAVSCIPERGVGGRVIGWEHLEPDTEPGGPLTSFFTEVPKCG